MKTFQVFFKKIGVNFRDKFISNYSKHPTAVTLFSYGNKLTN